MTIPEMVWVLNRQKECALCRESGKCTHECKKCPYFVEYTSLLCALDSIIRMVYGTGGNGRRK